MISVSVLFFVIGAIALVAAIVWVATQPGPAGPRTAADPPALGETGGHRGEIGAPQPLPPTRPSRLWGGRVSGPNGTTSWERWEPDETPPPQPQPGPAANAAVPPAELEPAGGR